VLRQNVFLVGHAGPLKRLLAKIYTSARRQPQQAHTCPYEYYYITEQTTDADMKQRKELINGTMVFVDQCIVRAAKHGKVLILEGVENAERNVLSLLNGILEERKMVLDDGTLLCDPAEFQHCLSKLTSDSINTTLPRSTFLPVHQDFFVICLGLPIPPYTGLPLDPPLRSRFQSKAVRVDENLLSLQQLHLEFPQLHRLVLQQIIQFSQFIHSIQQEQQNPTLGDGIPLASASNDIQSNFIPPLPFNHILDLYRIIHDVNRALSHSALTMLLQQVYPVHLLLRSIDNVTVAEAIQKELERTAKELFVLIHDSKRLDVSWDTRAQIHLNSKKEPHISFSSPTFRTKMKIHPGSPLPPTIYVSFDTYDSTLRNMYLTHTVNRDFCLVGNVSSGRSTLAQEFCRNLGLVSQTFSLNAEMSTRELFKMRRTDNHGNTYWSSSPLLECMQNGEVCILDNAELLPADVLMSLQSLVQDRELFLEDGSHYSTTLNLSPAHRIHPSFRIIAIASTPKSHRSSLSLEASTWLQDRGVLALFHFHVLEPLTRSEQLKLISKMHPEISVSITKNLLRFAHVYNAILRDESVSDKYKSIDLDDRHFKPLSLREVIQAVRRMHLFAQSETLRENILRLTLMESMPRRQQESLLKLLLLLKILPDLGSDTGNLNIVNTTDHISIGEVTLCKASHFDPAFVPKSLFFVENEDHTRVLKALLKDHLMSSQGVHPVHSLLMGAQGSGKNRITDRFLELINAEKEYIQLHRDTTLHTLTTSPSVEGGVITYIDSPLIRAATHGRILVVDELDKAPSEIVQMLRSLLVDGEMILPNGKILSSKRDGANILPIHKSFRIIGLSNPPHFPFHGNPVFISMGDAFSVHLVQNPTEEQELVILRAYAPHVDEKILSKLCKCFSDLRQLVREEQLSYPYSLRELVNISLHLEKFPEYGVVDALHNVTDFDLFDETTFQHLRNVFHKNGIPLEKQSSGKIYYADLLGSVTDAIQFDSVLKKHAIVPAEHVPELTHFQVRADSSFLAHAAQEETSVPLNSHRVQFLSELIYSVPLLCKYPRQVCAVGQSIHILSSSPDRLYSYNSELTRMRQVELFHYARLSCIHLCVLNGTPYILGLTFDDEGTFSSRSAANIQLFAVNESTLTKVPLQSSFSFRITEKIPTIHCARSTASDNAIVVYSTSNVWIISQSHGKQSKEGTTQPLQVRNISLSSVFVSTCLVLQSSQKEVLLLLEDVHNHYLLHVLEYKAHLRIVNDSLMRLVASCAQNDSDYCAVQEKTNELFQICLDGNDFKVLKSKKKVIIPQSKTAGKHLLVGQQGGTLRAYNCRTSTLTEMSLVADGISPADSDSSDDDITAEGSRIQLVDANMFGEKIITVHDDGKLRIFENKNPAILREEALQFTSLILGEHSLEAEAYQNAAMHTDSSIEDINVEGSASLGMGGAGGFGGFGGSGGSGGAMGFGERQQSTQSPGMRQNAATMSEEAQQRAREQAKQALSRHLEMIQMSEGDLTLYQKHVNHVSLQISRLRHILQDLRAKEREKKWLKGRVQGELDENKLVEGLAGERAIYKKRGKNEEKSSLKQKKKKLLYFTVDCSASMFRFNGFDSRLERMCDVAVLIMEALAGFESKFDYCIVGHSGMSTKFPLVSFSKPPRNRKERLQVIRKLVAHAQYCSAGDSTEASTYRAIRSLRRKDADERFLFVFSDANLENYGFDTKEFSRQIHKHASVETHLIFLSSGGEAAEKYAQDLPRRSHLCYNSSELANVFSSIFAASVLNA